jgi:hypothetical protein
MRVMPRQSVKSGVKRLREAVDSLGTPAEFRKLHAVLKAMELQVDDGHHQRHAVTRLCEALLATAQLYDVPEEFAGKLEEAACAVVALVEDSR